MKQKWVDAFMDTAERFAELSSAKRLKVGAVVVKDNRIISIGYNGMPAGWTNVCEEEIGHVLDDCGNIVEFRTKTKDEVIHAEANAILKLARDGESGNGADLFCTHAPCINCAKLIYGAGVRKVYYRESYRDTLGTDFLTKCNIEVEKYISKSVDLQVV
jgi:dCMP deaminase